MQTSERMGSINVLLSNLQALEVGLKSCNYTEGAALFYSFNSQQCLRHFSAAGENKYVLKCHYSGWNSRLCWLFGVYYCLSVDKNLVIFLNKNLEQSGIAKKIIKKGKKNDLLLYVMLNPLPDMEWSAWNSSLSVLVLDVRWEGLSAPVNLPITRASLVSPSFTVRESYGASRSKSLNAKWIREPGSDWMSQTQFMLFPYPSG